ncbi:MAG: hypothetical protein HQL46_00305 [Gammaproteobacteria bacterium]|nr:hypothetical protein [Gammaproteobacteria bacterium]
MYKFVLTFFALFLITPPICANTRDTIYVFGYLNSVDNKTWQNSHVGFGVKNQLKQILFDSNQFTIKEEKELKNREQTSNESWMLSKESVTIDNLKMMSKKNDINIIFWVEVVSFGKLNSKLFIGPFSSSSKRTNLVAKVCMFLSSSHEITCELGVGKSRRKSSSFLFTLKDHRQGRKVFDGSMVGKISNKAISDSATKLLEKLEDKLR